MGLQHEFPIGPTGPPADKFDQSAIRVGELLLTAFVEDSDDRSGSTKCMEANMTRSLLLAAMALALSGVSASAQAVYVAPGYYDYVAPAPVYVAPAPTVVVPSAVVPAWQYVAPSATVTAAAPLYDYVPSYSYPAGAITVAAPGW